MLRHHHTVPCSRHGCTPQQQQLRSRPVVGRRPRSSLRPLHAQGDTTGTSSSEAAPTVPAAAPAPSSSSSSSSSSATTRGPAAFNDNIPEQLFYEGSASNAELILSLLLAATLVYIPLTIAVVGKRLWIKYRFTNKRVQVINTSPFFAKEVGVSYRNIKEIRTAPRAFGLWGDAVIFLKDGSRLELTGLENYQDIKRHILSCIYDSV